MAASSLDEFVNEVKQRIEDNQVYRIRDMLQRILIEDQVSFLLASLNEIIKSSTLNYDAVKELIQLYKTHLQTMSKSGISYMPFNNKLNWIGAQTVRNFLPLGSK